MPASNTGSPDTLAIYVHWPFCTRICPYCDFNVVRHRGVEDAEWLPAYAAELAHLRDLTGGRTVTSIFFGGGTPSLMRAGSVSMLIETAARLWSVADAAEITLEANPTDAEARRFAEFRAAGVNRLSLGLQSLDDAALSFLGRWHSAAEGRAAAAIARRTFENVSFDLIYGRPGQDEAAWRRELSETLAMAPDHLSLYQLTIEPGTAFARAAARGTLKPMDGDAAAVLFETSQEICDAHGQPGYEISNHAVPGMESRHNLAYWTYADYGGIGPGAHGRVTVGGKKWATENLRAPGDWRERAVNTGTGLKMREALGAAQAARERIMMGLRLSTGVFLSDDDADFIDRERLEALVSEEFLTYADDRLCTTRRGRTVLDALLGEILR